jgi:hypothetical protein
VGKGDGEGEGVEGEGVERRGKKRGRGQNEYSGVVCLCGGGQRMVESACALDHHHPCLALYVPPTKFSLSQNVCVSYYPYNNVLVFWEASSFILGVLGGPGTWHHCPNPRSSTLYYYHPTRHLSQSFPKHPLSLWRPFYTISAQL